MQKTTCKFGQIRALPAVLLERGLMQANPRFNLAGTAEAMLDEWWARQRPCVKVCHRRRLLVILRWRFSHARQATGEQARFAVECGSAGHAAERRRVQTHRRKQWAWQ